MPNWEKRLKGQKSRPDEAALKTDIECNKKVWICMILESFRQWCSKSLMHNTRSGLEYVCVPNKNLQASRLDFDRQFSCFSSLPPSSPCYTCSRFSVISDDREDMAYYTVQWVKIFFLLKSLNRLMSFSW